MVTNCMLLEGSNKEKWSVEPLQECRRCINSILTGVGRGKDNTTGSGRRYDCGKKCCDRDNVFVEEREWSIER